MCGVQVDQRGQFLVGPLGFAAGRLALEHVQPDAQTLSRRSPPARAAVSTSGPRDVLTRIAPGFMASKKLLADQVLCLGRQAPGGC